jgi:hypothetical protein
MGMFDLFKSSGITNPIDSQGNELPDVFPFAINQESFIQTDVLTTYTKILTDAMERTHGLEKKVDAVLWDNCLQSEVQLGLISLLAKAMTNQNELYLVYSPSVNVLRIATGEERAKIRDDYEKSNESKVGVFISFQKYARTDMLRIYSSFEYCVLASLNKTVNLAKAVQFKMNDLRASVALIDSGKAIGQAQNIASALQKGKDVLLDAKDSIENAEPDTSATEKAITFLNAKRAYTLGLPMSYISGLQTGGIGSTGEGDTRAVERGLRQYHVSVLKPALKALFGVETTFKSADFREITSGLETLKVFELTSDDILSRESKQEIIARMFELDIDQEKRLIKKQGDETPKPQDQPAKPVDGKQDKK